MIDVEELKKVKKMKILDMSNEDYHNNIGLSSSNVKKILNDIDSYHYEKENPPPRTDALKFGTMFDELVFDEKLFESKYFHSQALSKVSKEFKEDVKNNPDHIVLKKQETALLFEMAKSLENSKVFCEIMENAETMSSYFTYETFFDNIFRVRPDIRKNSIIWDLKTCADIDDRSLKNSIRNFGYDLSLGMYCNIINKFTPIEGAGWIFVSKKPPHQVRILSMSESDFDKTCSMAAVAVVNASEKLDSGDTTYSDQIQEFSWRYDDRNIS